MPAGPTTRTSVAHSTGLKNDDATVAPGASVNSVGTRPSGPFGSTSSASPDTAEASGAAVDAGSGTIAPGPASASGADGCTPGSAGALASCGSSGGSGPQSSGGARSAGAPAAREG